MAEYISAFAPDELPALQYTRVNAGMAAAIEAAMEEPENQKKFEVTLLPVGTELERRLAAEEWAGYRQALGQVAARDRGAALVVNDRDESPEYFAELLADVDRETRQGFETHALLRLKFKTKDAQMYDLLAKYYEQAIGSGNPATK